MKPKDGIEFARPRVLFFLKGEAVSEEAYREVYPLENAGRKYFLGGAILDEWEYFNVHPTEGTGTHSAAGLVTFKPVHSLSLRVRPDQIEEAREVARKKGVPTDFTPDGRPVFNSSRHMREYAKRHGYRHQDY